VLAKVDGYGADAQRLDQCFRLAREVRDLTTELALMHRAGAAPEVQ
jgi:hypothetical protein